MYKNGCNISQNHISQNFRFLHAFSSKSSFNFLKTNAISWIYFFQTQITEYKKSEHATHEQVENIYPKIKCHAVFFTF